MRLDNRTAGLVVDLGLVEIDVRNPYRSHGVHQPPAHKRECVRVHFRESCGLEILGSSRSQELEEKTRTSAPFPIPPKNLSGGIVGRVINQRMMSRYGSVTFQHVIHGGAFREISQCLNSFLSWRECRRGPSSK